MAYFLSDSFMFLSGLFTMFVDWDDCIEFLYFQVFWTFLGYEKLKEIGIVNVLALL